MKQILKFGEKVKGKKIDKRADRYENFDIKVKMNDSKQKV